MNLRGSYKALRNNSKAAILAAIEIYNKPQISYRDECFSILLLNAWELLLKAIISKNKQHIYYPKERGVPHRTFALRDAIFKARRFFPDSIPYEPVAENIRILETYRNNSIHFYNKPGFGVMIYGLAQTCIVNYKDLMLSIFNVDISNEMTLNLLPLSFTSRPDPIEFIRKVETSPPTSRAVVQFIREVSRTAQELEARKFDTYRFLTVFKVNFQSVKKITQADIVTGVRTSVTDEDVLVVERRVDPNISHPLRRKDILEKVGSVVNGAKFTAHTFQAIVWKYDIKNKPNLFWHSDAVGSTQYSNDLIPFIKRFAKGEIETAALEFSLHNQKQRKEKKKK